MAELSRRVLRLGILIFAATLFGCDHATKIAAHAALAPPNKALPIYDGIVELRYARNDDTAFSLLHNLGVTPNAHAILALACLAFTALLVIWFLSRKKMNTLQHIGFAVIVAGALGNVVDRAIRGYVVDFIHVWRWPVFNVADILVVVGAFVFVLARTRKKHDGSDDEAAPQSPAAA
jgi:signal peptidase II